VAEPVAGSIRPLYADWHGYNRRITEAIRRLTPEDLALVVPMDRTEGGGWPIWAVAAHTVGARTWWLCQVLGEPGAETTPFTDPTGFGWEDDLSTVRSGEEVADAWTSTWRVVESCLDRWTVPMLSEEIPVFEGRAVQTRQSILLRMLTHEAYHAGEIGLTLASNGREPIDLWPGADWRIDAPRSLREG
jgi:uncharacterized damage-inducible protein DinB